jgi:hypothetical protein
MKSFLENVAEELYADLGNKIADARIILPSRRACMYFKIHLAKIIDRNIFCPYIRSFEDFVYETADVELEDPITLLFDLYQSYQQFDKKEQSLEYFTPLGLTLLKDFNLIDKELLDGTKLFAHLEQVKAIERWGEEYGIDISMRSEGFLKDYYQFWTYLKQTYFHFREKLLKKKKVYSGLAYHWVCDNFEKIDKKITNQPIAFVGFNQISKAENFIIAEFLKLKQAKIYWDIDTYFLENPIHEAGEHIRKNIKNGLLSQSKNKVQKYLSQAPKELEIIAVNNSVTQAKLAGEILTNALKGKTVDFKQQINHTAVLLPDEQMLMPLLYSLPQNTETSIDELINITMGISLKETPLFTLISNLFSIQSNILTVDENQKNIHYKDISRVLYHPYLQFSEKNNQLLKRIQKENLVYVPIQKLHTDSQNGELYQLLFRDWKGNVQNCIAYFYDLLAFLSKELNPETHKLDLQYLFDFYTLIKRLEITLKDQKDMSILAFKRFLINLLTQQRVPFTSEPLRPIQIMGMLESRTLDFEHVIILSCNETILPKAKSYDSLIPHSVKNEFSLPTHLSTDATFAYTFFRLFQRAKKITLIYSTEAEGGKVCEKSRFISQIENEFKQFSNIKITKKQLLLELPQIQQKGKTIQKDKRILDRIKDYLANDGLSPSLMNVYIREPMEFFEKKILKINQDQNVEEEMAANTFGSLIHKVLEKIFESHVGKQITGSQLYELGLNKDKQIDQLIQRTINEDIGGILQDRGKNYLLKNLSKHLITSYLKQQKQAKNFTVLAQEKTLYVDLKLTILGKKTAVKIKGQADRIDLLETGDGTCQIRIIDYKTGFFDKSKLSITSIEELLENPEKEKVVQLLLYKYLVIKNLQNNKIANLPNDFDLAKCSISSAFIFFRQLNEGLQFYKFKNEAKELNLFVEELEKFLTLLISNILDEQKPFGDTVQLNIEELM